MDADIFAAGLELAINIGFPLLLLAFAMLAGTITERAHFRRIHAREVHLLDLPALNTRAWDPARPVAEARLACGAVVVSADYFRSFLAGLRNLFGGRVRSFESILDRGRREAVLRMKESVPGAHLILNVRLETSTIGTSQNSNQSALGVVEIVAYGTAIYYADAA